MIETYHSLHGLMWTCYSRFTQCSFSSFWYCYSFSFRGKLMTSWCCHTNKRFHDLYWSWSCRKHFALSLSNCCGLFELFLAAFRPQKSTDLLNWFMGAVRDQRHLQYTTLPCLSNGSQTWCGNDGNCLSPSTLRISHISKTDITIAPNREIA